MRDFCYRNYIPDITERYPEGFRDIDNYDSEGDTSEDSVTDEELAVMFDEDEIIYPW